MNYAVIKTGGKQYRVSVGDVIDIEILDGVKIGDSVDFSEVLLTNVGGDIKIGTPNLDTKVVGKIKDIGKDKKIHVYKFKAKSRYRKKIGHRKKINSVEILSIGKAVKVTKKDSDKAVKKTA